MLKEFEGIRQTAAGRRRNFVADGYDLYAWYDDNEHLYGFQLVYGLGDEQKALTWTEKEGYFHNNVDEGESGRFKQTPLLVPDGVFAPAALLARLEPLMVEVEAPVRELVLDRIRGFSTKN